MDQSTAHDDTRQNVVYGGNLKIMKSKIKNNFLFFINFFKNPLTNASIIPTSKTAAQAMLQDINFEKVNTVIELGSGTGTVSEKIIKNCKPDTKIILVEFEPDYVKILKDKFGNKVIIENQSAHLLEEILKKHKIKKIDLIVSELPFLPKDIKQELFKSLKKQTENGTIFRFLTYMPRIMKHVYKDLPIKKKYFVIKNFPPLWIFGIN